MPFCHAVFSVVALLLVSAECGSGFKLSARCALHDGHHKRLLRGNTIDESEEERGISANLPDHIANIMKSSKTKNLEGLLRADDSAEDAFWVLKLKEIPRGRTYITPHYPYDIWGIVATKETVVNFFTSKNFQVWSEHVAKVNKGYPEAAMLTTLTKAFGEQHVAAMILLSKDSWRTRKISKKLETAQFNKWFHEGKGPNKVLGDGFKLANSVKPQKDAEEAWKKLKPRIVERYRAYWMNREVS